MPGRCSDRREGGRVPRGWMGAVAGEVRHGGDSYEGSISARRAGATEQPVQRYDERTIK